MRVNFRQGIISYPVFGNVQQFLKPNGNYVDLNADNGDILVTFAHKQSNYLHIETDTISQAWGPITSGVNNWLYWDINLTTGQIDFGHTLVQPVVNVTQPTSPVSDLHWFDKASNTMKVYITGGFREKVRVFAAVYDGVTFSPVGQGILNLPFAGTQVGLNTSNFSGRIILDDSGKPIKRSTGEFFHTESQFFASGSLINSVRLESNTTVAQYATNVSAFTVVSYTNNTATSPAQPGVVPSTYGVVETASYPDVGETVVALALEDGVVGDARSVLLQGIATNPNWSWQTIGVPLWVENGLLVETDPHQASPSVYPVGTVPVARVLSRTSIIFEQGLGGKGDRGPIGSIEDITPASTSELGGVALSATPSLASFPIAVETNDPRMSDARTPSAPHANSVVKSGSTMTGFLTLSGAPTANLHAATKKYVDDRAEYDIHSQANGTLGTSVPSLITHIVAVRAFTVQASGHQAFARVGPTGSNAIFTIKVNGVSKGTLTFTTTAGSPNVDQLQSFTLTSTSINVGDSITVELTTADSNDDLADVAITIVGKLAT